MKTLIIRASEWARGNQKDEDGKDITNYLYAPSTDTSCCLGIHALQCGASKKDLSKLGEPEEISHEVITKLNNYPWIEIEDVELDMEEGDVLTYPMVYNTPNVQDAIEINDSDLEWTDDERIDRLRPLFKEVGWEIDWRPNE
jgi:hypothetical protein